MTKIEILNLKTVTHNVPYWLLTMVFNSCISVELCLSFFGRVKLFFGNLQTSSLVNFENFRLRNKFNLRFFMPKATFSLVLLKLFFSYFNCCSGKSRIDTYKKKRMTRTLKEIKHSLNISFISWSSTF